MDILDYVQKQSAILVIGSPRSEKSLFAKQIIMEGFKRGERAVYILTNNFPEDTVAELGKGIGMFHIEKNMLRVIDCYTNFVGVPRPGSDTTIVVSSPAALNEISIALAKAIKDISPASVVIDSASTILLQSPHLYEKFFQVIIGKLKSYAIKSIILLEDGIHSQKEIAVLKSLTSATLRFIEENKEKYIEIKGMGTEQRSHYEVQGSKFLFKELA